MHRGASVKAEDLIECAGHQTSVDTFVVGINPQKFTDSRLNATVRDRIKALEEYYQGRTVIIGVDRLDYTKGLAQKFEGYSCFLQQHPELRDKVTLIQVAVPSREGVKEYQDLEEKLCTLVGKINGKYGIQVPFLAAYLLQKCLTENISYRRRIATHLHASFSPIH